MRGVQLRFSAAALSVRPGRPRSPRRRRERGPFRAGPGTHSRDVRASAVRSRLRLYWTLPV